METHVADHLAGAPLLSGLHVLVVDDDPGTLEILSNLLKHYGAIVIAVTSVREVLEVLDVLRPDVILSDIAMPGRTGFDLLQELESRDGGESSIPVVAVTAQFGPEDRERMIALGFQDFVPKPVEPSNLVGVVARLGRPATP
ncbi:MAG: response regulator [Acidobacteriota bacterium]